MGVENGDAFTVLNILSNKIEQQRGFPRAGCANDMGMSDPMLRG